MKEKLYTIPVNDAYASDCECPICKMYGNIEQDAIEFTMGPSYMEDDIRMVTDKKGFCSNHITKLYRHQNRLGLALMLDTHIKRTINENPELHYHKDNEEYLKNIMDEINMITRRSE